MALGLISEKTVGYNSRYARYVGVLPPFVSGTLRAAEEQNCLFRVPQAVVSLPCVPGRRAGDGARAPASSIGESTTSVPRRWRRGAETPEQQRTNSSGMLNPLVSREQALCPPSKTATKAAGVKNAYPSLQKERTDLVRRGKCAASSNIRHTGLVGGNREGMGLRIAGRWHSPTHLVIVRRPC